MNVSKRKKHLVTSALIYANGPIHIGHLAGCYIPSDIYVRYLRSIGDDVKFISGTDEHGVPITIKARNEKKKPKEVVDYYYSQIKKDFEEFGISFDIFSRTSNELHHKTSSEFFKELHNNSVFVEKESSQYYDEAENQFLSDRYIKGECPSCSYEAAYGDQCEKCGSSLSPSDLKNPVSTLSNNKPIMKKTKNWYLPMDKLQGKIENYLEDKSNWKSNVIGQCNSWLKEGLKPRAMTRDLDWGVKVPVENAEGKVLYVWFDAPIGYITATKELIGDNWEDYWKDKDTNLVHFIGKDNIVFHCIIFPAMLKAEGSYILPTNVPANEFLNLEGQKLSTSKNWAVWLPDYLEEFPGKQDVLRYVLTATAPETKDNDFTWKDFQARNNNELVAIFGNFINRVMVLTTKYYQGIAPTPQIFSSDDLLTLDLVKSYPVIISKSIERYRFREASQEFMNLARLGNKFLADAEPWKVIKTEPFRVQTIMYIALQIAAALAVLSEPLLPASSKKLKSMLNLDSLSWKNIERGDPMIKPSHQIGESELLFAKIEDAEIDFQLDKLAKSKLDNETANKKIESQKETVSFEDFSKLDIRVGTVLEAKKMPKAKKLLVLKVDTGIDVRTIVSGIADSFTAEEVIGKRVTVLINLAPRNLRGVESQGMILMTETSSGKLVFVNPDNSHNAKNGLKIS